MLVYGGIDENKNYLNDIWALDLMNFVWVKIEPRSNIRTHAVAFHSSVMAYTSDKRDHISFKIFSQNDIPLPKNNKKVIHCF